MLCSPRIDAQTDRQTHTHTDTKVNTEHTLSGFQDFFPHQGSVQFSLSGVSNIPAYEKGPYGKFEKKTPKKRRQKVP